MANIKRCYGHQPWIALVFLIARVGFAQSGTPGASLRSIDSIARVNSEAPFVDELRRLGCNPLVASGTAGTSWIDVVRRNGIALRSTLVGNVPSTPTGRPLQTVTYAETPAYTLTRALYLTRIDSVPTFAYVMRPRARVDAPIVILLHGSGTLPHQAFGLRLDAEGGAVTRPDSTLFIGLGLDLASAGFTVVAPLLGRLPPQRQGELPWIPTSLAGGILREKTGLGGVETLFVSEIQAAIDYAVSQHGSPDQGVYLVGWSEGAYVASLVGGLDARVRAVVRLEWPYDRKAYRNSEGMLRDASFAHAECAFGDVAQATLLGGKPLLYATAGNDANERQHAPFRVPAIVDSIRLLYNAPSAQRRGALDFITGSSAAVKQITVDWLLRQVGIPPHTAAPFAVPRIPPKLKFPEELAIQRTNVTGSYLGRLPSCRSVMPAIQNADNNPARNAQTILTALQGGISYHAPGRILTRAVLDSSRGYRLSLVSYGGSSLRPWRALLAEPLDATSHPGMVSFNGIDNLDDLFAYGPKKGIYLNGYADEFARRGFVVIVPIVPYWVPNGVSTISAARTAGRSSGWAVMLDTFRSAVDALIALPNVDASRIAGYGISYGGFAGLLATATDPRISSLVFNNVPEDYQSVFDRPAGAFTSPWLADACSVADAAMLAIAPRTLLWEAGEDPLALNESMDIVVRVRQRYRYLGVEERFTFKRHSGGHATIPTEIRIFDR